MLTFCDLDYMTFYLPTSLQPFTTSWKCIAIPPWPSDDLDLQMTMTLMPLTLNGKGEIHGWHATRGEFTVFVFFRRLGCFFAFLLTGVVSPEVGSAVDARDVENSDSLQLMAVG